ncbi:MAG: DUF1501 domain-containing protein [Planctomycetaceae bacterium]|nr:DUF1501 domain-containing protein [Planctomycetaceae bacterium]
MTTVSRRRLLQVAGAGFCGYSASSWLPALADEIAPNPNRKRHCVLLWMSGGPSQMDTFDMKPGHANGGEFKEIATKVPGLRISEHLPRLAEQADKLAIVRGLSTKEGDHGRGTYLMRTGHQPRGPVRFPAIGASLSKELSDSSELALNFVSVSPYRAFNQAAYGPGFLGPKYAPLTVGATDNLPITPDDMPQYADLRVDDLTRPANVSELQFEKRIAMWRKLQDGFLATHRSASPIAHDTVYRRALKLMDSNISQAFDLEEEPAAVRDAYGRGRFGQGCLMARRLIERGVAFVEVSLGAFDGGNVGWDTHQNNFPAVRQLSNDLDAGWATLMTELDERGLLESTTILWMGEFGRTPAINDNAGRDHFPGAWTCVFGGGGIKGGQAYGKTSDDGTEVVEGKANEADVLATLCSALGVKPDKENISEQGRPIKIAEGTAIKDILA